MYSYEERLRAVKRDCQACACQTVHEFSPVGLNETGLRQIANLDKATTGEARLRLISAISRRPGLNIHLWAGFLLVNGVPLHQVMIGAAASILPDCTE